MADLYVITPKAEDALECFGLNGVRHVAELDTGEGFVACENRVNAPVAGVVFRDESDDEFWFGPKIRRIAPTSDHDPEIFGLYSAEAFRAVNPLGIQMASMVGMGLVLAMTYGRTQGAIWQASATRYLDARLSYPALV